MPSRRPAAPRSRRPASRPGARTTSRPARSTARSRATGATKTAPAKSTAKSTPKGKSSGRPTGPAREERRRSRLGLVLPEVLTVRLLVLAVVGLLAFVLLLPTVRGAVQQQAEIDKLQAELAANQVERTELTDELARWDDRSYVVEQARTRLNYVMPGDTVWRVVDADEVPDGAGDGSSTDGGTADGEEPAPAQTVAPTGPVGAPWYQAMWESMQVADDAASHPAGEGDEPDPSDVEPEAGGGGE